MNRTDRREFIRNSMIAGAGVTAAIVPTGSAEGMSYGGPASAKDRFSIGLIVGDKPERPPAEIAPGYEMSEMPISIQVLPLDTKAAWARKKAEFAAWKIPPPKVSSHYNPPGGRVLGPDIDNELLDFWMARSFARIAELGIEVVGVYGAFFEPPEGFPQTKARDQALQFVNKLADHAKRYKMRIALEPMGEPKTLFPLYRDGVTFARQTGRPEICVMADTAYFVQREQPLEDIAKAPELCIHCQTAGVKGQPGVGDLVELHTRLFRIFRDIKYKGAVSCACPWVDTTGSGKLQFGIETAKTLKYLQDLRDKVYSE